MTSRNSMLANFLGGLAAGVTLGILVAPRSGKETREQIAAKAKQAEASMKEMVANTKASWYAAKDQVSDTTGVLASEVDDFIQHILNQGKAWWYGTKADAYELADEIEEKVQKAGTKAKAALKDS